jgi:ATP-dependent exoDNAse (exonuclease V) beta subunit
MASPAPRDQKVRDRAIDVSGSFLVQAPAGSGKTELLIQRYLGLLGRVDQPEEILAITFTRKAAAEMRDRVLGALDRARRENAPEEAHLKRAYELARAAVARDEECGWGLAENATRLRIGTIDSVNAWLNSRAPLTAGLQSMHRVAEQPDALYREAARQTLALAAESGAAGRAVWRFLQHCDNRVEIAIRLIENMLASRDQWLRHTGSGQIDERARGALEASLARLVEDTLSCAHGLLPDNVRKELATLLSFAATNLADRGGDSDLVTWKDREQCPAPAATEVAAWRGLAQCLLTQKGDWRKPGGLDVRIGFPATAKDPKARMKALLERLADDDELRRALAALQHLPDASYSDTQWESLKSIVQVLPLAAAVLLQVFDQRGETDFTQLATNALATLGSDEIVGELALVLDYALRHVLLDEYQDTSRSQFELLKRLTAGWEPGDGRTLFLVGDPMQSIYRFREAEVGIFLETRVSGLDHLPLEFLRLTTNFRSAPEIVNWVNAAFATIMPADEDPISGAVPLAASVAYQPSADDAGVRWHCAADSDTEADAIVECVRVSLECAPGGTVGILVRSRSHAARIGPRLRSAGIGYSAPDLELLGEEPVIHDLLGLTRALLHPADRIAWLAVLRAPWCGLTLNDLHRLAAPDASVTISARLADEASLTALSADGQQRARRLALTMSIWGNRRGALPLRDLVEGTWQGLGGPGCLESTDELEIAAEFFHYLDEVDTGGDCSDVAELLDGITGRPVLRESAHDARVQLLTMHKAKGLEFDTVLLPALNARTQVSSRPPLLWHELSTTTRHAELVLAPLQPRGEGKCPLFEMLWQIERQRDRYELQRLLYVAATRARKRLHLYASPPRAAASDGKDFAPATGSLLGVLWPAEKDTVLESLATLDPLPADPQTPAWVEVPLRRLPSGWQVPEGARPSAKALPLAKVEEHDTQESGWAIHAGTVAHRWLEEIAREGPDAFDSARLNSLSEPVRIQLVRLGLSGNELELAHARVLAALQTAVADPDGRWILETHGAGTQSEWSLTEIDLPERRIDRSFVDAKNQRWIIDYKIAAPAEGESEENFIRRQAERYRAQLAGYRRVISKLAGEGRPLRLALYFPLLPRLVELQDEFMAELE